LVLAAAGGLAWGLCFARQPLSLASWAALVPLLLLLRLRRAPVLGFTHGFVFWLVSIPWIAPTLKTYGELPGWLSVLALLALAAYLASFQALFAGLARPLWMAGGTAALLGPAAVWVGVEWLRAHLFTGFAWNPAAHAWAGVAGALPLTAWIGSYGLSFLVVFANCGLAVALRSRSWRPVLVTTGVCLVLLAMGGRWAAGAETMTDRSRARPVRVIQPNTENLTVWDAEQVETNYRRLLELSRQACNQQGALIVWPESAAWPFSIERHARLRADVEALAAAGCPVVFNSVLSTPDGDANAALLVSEKGVQGRYDKRHLVPFGEYVPFARWLPFLDKLARNAGEYAAGREVALLPWGRERIGIGICFEIIFPDEMAQQVREGAGLLITITNDAWYGDTWAPWQHFRAARFRAAENRRYLLRAAITGVSAIIAPDGSVIQLLGVREAGILAGAIEGRHDLSPFTRVPWAVPLLCSVLAGSAILIVRRRRGP
jgi:apolipoprotein N-acyltransferase